MCNNGKHYSEKRAQSFGLVCNEDKSHWDPAQVGEWLGFIINSISMKFFLPAKKVNKLKRLLETVISGVSYSASCLAKIAGTVITFALAVGPITDC